MKYIFVCFILCTSLTLKAQEKQHYTYSNTPLTSVIAEIREKHKILFSFANDIVNEKVITLTTDTPIALDELLTILEAQTGLSFQKVSKSQIIITGKQPTLSNQILEEVIISGYVTSGIDRNKDGSIDVTSNSLGILPGLVVPDLLQSIQLVPGISSLDESASGIQIRGGSPDQNLILFDGIKLFNSGYLYGMFSAFNPYATEKVTLFKAGTSAFYGDRISGIIDISTGEQVPEKTISGFGMDGLSADAYVKTPVSDNLAVYVFARRSYTDALKTPTYDGYAKKIFRNSGIVKDINGRILSVENDDDYTVDTSTNTFSFYDLNAKIIYDITAKDKLILSSLFTRNTLDFSFTGDGETKTDDLVTRNNGLSLKWQHKSSDARHEEITAYFSKYRSFYLNEEHFGTLLEETNIRENTISDFGLNLTSHRIINEKQSFKFGYQMSNSNVSVDLIKTEPLTPEENESFINKAKNFKNAVFGEYTYTAKNSALISTGLRTVHYGSVGDLFLEPRLNIEYPISDQLRIKSSFERRNQPISQLVEFNQTELRLENNLWRLSDSDTYPLLQSNQMSGGFLFHGKGWTIDFDAYLKELSGLTTFTNGFSTPQLELEEGKSTIKGMEVLIKKRIDNYRIWLGYTYNDIDFNFSGIQAGAFPGNNDITHSFRLSNTLKLNNFQLSLGWQYRTGEPFTPIANFDPTNSVVAFGDINSARLEDYHRLDASAIYNFKFDKKKNSKGQLGFSVLNLYNRIKPISIIYRTEEEDAGLELKQVIQRYSLGFTPNVSFRLFF
ncbi:TonB-dependent receptor plug domain-containing protein [Seonamhaeicola sp.]|uniref:TonB-dependent receptor plug domain-containing protein n=1 Tax=Seonamhaeicola sp. TaxID=1912245 RepID=UPI00262D448C|nr:TonB-dependent receptor plug domain-containing protein [Seonamhaeicola sp.]